MARYEDDGALVASDEQQLQLALDTLFTSLAPFGWEVSSKTKAACFPPAIAHTHVAEDAYEGTDEAAAFVQSAREVPRGAGGRVTFTQMTSIEK